MKKRALSSIVAIILSFVLVFAVVGCTSDSGVTLSQTELTMGVGDIQTLRATTEDNSDVVWSSSDDTVATVLSGMITAKNVGEATITATSKSAGSATCKVTVADFVVTLSQTTATVEKGEPFTLTASTTMNGQPYSGDKYTWSSENESIATVSGGTVTGIREGTVKITARRSAGTASASCEVTVNWANKPDGYYEIDHFEQNKVPQNTWGRWANQGFEGGGRINMNLAEYQNSADSQAGIASFNFTVETHGTLAGADLQVVYRSAGEGGSLKTGTYYSLTADVTSSVAGDITLNGTDFTLEANKKTTITSYFLHADDGTIYPDKNYDNIYYTGVFLLLGNLGESGDTIDFTIEKLQWKEFTPAALKAPTVAMSGDKATVTDTENEAELVNGYEIGFFDTADAETPKYTVKATESEATINSAAWNNGTYIVKARALPATGQYQASPWSAATDVTYTVAHETVVYDLPYSGGNNVNITYDGWFYYNELGEKTEEEAYGLVEAKYDDGTITYEFTSTQGNWYSHQLFYNYASVAQGIYTVTFKFTSSVEGTIRICDAYYDFTAGETKTITATKTPGIMISVQFGKATDDFSGTASAITAGRFTITEVEITSGSEQPQPGTETLGEAINAKFTEVRHGAEKKGNDDADGADVSPNVWILWWREWDPVVTMNPDYKIENNVLTFSFSGGPTDGDASWATQLFYNNTELTQGKTYRLFMKINSDAAYTINVNGVPVVLTEGDNDVNVKFTLAGDISAVDIQFPSPEAHTIKISDVYWKEVTGGQSEQPQPEPPTPGTKYQPSYDKKIQGAEMTSEWDKVGTDNNPDTWVYWYVADASWEQGAVVNEFSADFDGNAFVVNYKDGEKDYSVQVFYKNSQLLAGQIYTLTCKINASVQTKAIINGKEMTLNAGDNTITVVFTLNAAGAQQNGVSAIDFQFPKQTQKITLKISDVEWTAGDTTSGTQPETPAGGKEISVTATEWYGNGYVKLSMSDEDFALVKEAASCKVNDADTKAFGDGKGFLVDGNLLQVQLSEDYGEGKTYSVVWYDAEGNAIAHATFSYTA